MARTTHDKDVRKLQASYKALQDDLSAVMKDIEQMASTGRDLGLERTRAQVDRAQEQIEALMQDTANGAQRAVDTVRRRTSESPMAVLAAAFATGFAAATLFGRRQ